MPRLKLFAVCRKAIVDKDDFSISLIELLDEITIDKELPPKTAVQLPWTAISLYKAEATDISGANYQQRFELRDPEGQLVVDYETPPQPIPGSHYQAIRLTHFPATRGAYEVSLFFRQIDGEESPAPEYERVASYPIVVRVQPAEAPPTES